MTANKKEVNSHSVSVIDFPFSTQVMEMFKLTLISSCLLLVVLQQEPSWSVDVLAS